MCDETLPQPLRKRKIWEKTSLTDEEVPTIILSHITLSYSPFPLSKVTLVRKLRQEDGSIWSVATLSRLLKVSPAIIRCGYILCVYYT